jgi:hypothetical protein
MNVDCRMNVVAVDARCPNCQVDLCSMKSRAVRQLGSGILKLDVGFKPRNDQRGLPGLSA